MASRLPTPVGQFLLDLNKRDHYIYVNAKKASVFRFGLTYTVAYLDKLFQY